MDYRKQYDLYVSLLEERLDQLLPDTGDKAFFSDNKMPGLLADSMRYSLLAGGKRIRPVLLLAVCDMLDGDCEQALTPAAALEMIHTYSLIHDDLPGMDDDDYRRGRLTNHKVYGVGQAILAGDGLLNYAYECLLKNALSFSENLEAHVRAMEVIAGRAGCCGMIAGQVIDLISEKMPPDENRLLYIHTHKTADLLIAPLLAAAYIAGASKEQQEALKRFGTALGIAFQIDDDLLDVLGDAGELGKMTGMDAQRGKLTWPSLYGIDGAKARSSALWNEAEAALQIFGEKGWFLREFSEKLRVRKK